MRKFVVFLLLFVSVLVVALEMEMLSMGEWGFLSNPAKLFFTEKKGFMGSYKVFSSEGESLGTFTVGFFQSPEAKIAGALYLQRSSAEAFFYKTTLGYSIALEPVKHVKVGVGVNLVQTGSTYELALSGGLYGNLMKDFGYSIYVRDFRIWSSSGDYMGGEYVVELFYETPNGNKAVWSLSFDQETLETGFQFVIGQKQRASIGVFFLNNLENEKKAFKLVLGFYGNVENVAIGFDTHILSDSVSSDRFNKNHYKSGTGVSFSVRW